jgi:coiled-coil domain-containing protein 63/114
MLRPKLSITAAIEERQHALHKQIEVYTAKIEIDQRTAEELEKSTEDVNDKISELQRRAQAKISDADRSQDELEKSGYKRISEGRQTRYIGPYGEKYANKSEILRAMSYIPDQVLKKKLSRLEVRLNSILIKFNDSLSTNKKLRKEIDSLRKERLRFDLITNKLQNALITKKAEIANAIEVMNVALETRDEADRMIAGFRSEISKNQLEFDAEWHRLDDAMEDEEERRRKLVRARIEEEAKRFKATEEDAAQKAQLHALTAKYNTSRADIERFEEAYRRLQEATNLKDIDELIQTFLEAEEHNFKLFSFLGALNCEEEQLTAEVREELAALQADSESAKTADFRRKIETQLAFVHAKAERYAEMRLEEEAKVKNMLKIAKRMFHELGCTKYLDAGDSFACDSGGALVTDTTMLGVLGMIERRASELILSLKCKKALEVDSQPTVAGIQVQGSGSPGPP